MMASGSIQRKKTRASACAILRTGLAFTMVPSRSTPNRVKDVFLRSPYPYPINYFLPDLQQPTLSLLNGYRLPCPETLPGLEIFYLRRRNGGMGRIDTNRLPVDLQGHGRILFRPTGDRYQQGPFLFIH